MRIRHVIAWAICCCILCMGSDVVNLWSSWAAGPGRWKLDSVSSWERSGSGERVLKVSVPAGTPDRSIIYGGKLYLNLKPLRGKYVEFAVESKHCDLTDAPKEYLGYKMMLEKWDAKGEKAYTGGGQGKLTLHRSDWRTVRFVVWIAPEDVAGTFHLGVQSATGNLWFKNLRYRLVEPYKPIPLPEGFRCEYTEAVTRLPRLRGCMSPGLSNGARAEDLRVLSSWGANAIRWQVNVPKEDAQDLVKVRQIFQDHLRHLDVHLPQLRRDGLHVIFDFHGVPGGRYKWNPLPADVANGLVNRGITDNAFLMFRDRRYLDAFVDLWRMVARHYKDEPIVVAYDLYNEPFQTGLVPYDYLYCQYEAAKAIREIDSEKPIIVTSNRMSAAPAFSYLQPLPLKNVIYQCHMYTPGDYTHQGVWGTMHKLRANPSLLKGYPGRFGGVYYDREELKKVFDPVRRFQQTYGARIYVGEFSAIRFAPGAAQYLEDLISIYEEYGWDWTYHAFRESPYWSVEYDEDIRSKKPSSVESPRKKVLLKYFSRNEKRTY